MTDRELMQQALRYMESVGQMDMYPEEWAIVVALRSRLAQPEQEPVAHVYLFEPNGRPRVAWDNAKDIKIGDKLYTTPPQGIYYTPPQRKWVGLTDEEALELWNKHEKHWRFENNALAFTRAIEAAHGIKGEA